MQVNKQINDINPSITIYLATECPIKTKTKSFKKLQNQIYSWDEIIKFKYKNNSYDRFYQLYCLIEIYSDKSTKNPESIFLGDFEIDLFSLFVGPKNYKVKLIHSVIEDSELSFNIDIIQRSLFNMRIMDVCINNLPDDEKKVMVMYIIFYYIDMNIINLKKQYQSKLVVINMIKIKKE